METPVNMTAKIPLLSVIDTDGNECLLPLDTIVRFTSRGKGISILQIGGNRIDCDDIETLEIQNKSFNELIEYFQQP